MRQEARRVVRAGRCAPAVPVDRDELLSHVCRCPAEPLALWEMLSHLGGYGRVCAGWWLAGLSDQVCE